MSKLEELQKAHMLLLAENEQLKTENKEIIEAQKKFTSLLINKITAIKQLGPFKRWMSYGKLLWDLIWTIESQVNDKQA